MHPWLLEERAHEYRRDLLRQAENAALVSLGASSQPPAPPAPMGHPLIAEPMSGCPVDPGRWKAGSAAPARRRPLPLVRLGVPPHGTVAGRAGGIRPAPRGSP